MKHMKKRQKSVTKEEQGGKRNLRKNERQQAMNKEWKCKVLIALPSLNHGRN